MPTAVIPAQAGIQGHCATGLVSDLKMRLWDPASAGTTAGPPFGCAGGPDLPEISLPQRLSVGIIAVVKS